MFWQFVILVPFLFTAWLLRAQSAEDQVTHSLVSSPVLGYAFDSAARGVRPILGIPGASLVGKPLNWGLEILNAVVSPQRDYALVVVADMPQTRVVQLRSGSPAALPVADVALAPDRIVLSPSGSAAALLNFSADLIQILVGLPDNPSVVREISASQLGGPSQLIAISDDGQALLAATTGDDTKPLLLLDADGQVRSVATLSSVSALRFRPDSHDALISLSGETRILRVPDVMVNPVVSIWIDVPGIDQPMATDFSGDGRRLIVAGARGNIAIIDIFSGVSQRISCQCVPSGLHRLNGNSLFRLNELSENPLLLFDASRSMPRVFFVPRSQTSETPEGLLPQGGDQ